MKVAIYTEKGEKKEDRDIKSPVFEAAVNPVLVHEAVVTTMANRRMDNAKVKTRAEVSGGGKKPWKQKGTGRARSGSIRNPIWRGGGIIFGPTGEQNHYRQMPKKKRRSALVAAIAAKKNDIMIVEGMPDKGTKEFATVSEKLVGNRRGLYIYEKLEERTIRASRNIQNAKAAEYRNLNAYEVLACDKLVFVGKSIDGLLDFLG